MREAGVKEKGQAKTIRIVPRGAPLPKPPVTLVTSLGHFVPEIGQSITTAHQENVDRLAIQIVSMMEKPW